MTLISQSVSAPRIFPLKPFLESFSFHRSFYSTSSSVPRHTRSIAVIGAGLSGLTTALYLSRGLPNHRITLVESSGNVGGWVQSSRIGLLSGGSRRDAIALLEAGPRSIRPAGLPGLTMLDLILSLNLSSELIKVPKSHPSAKKRYLYYNGKIHEIPHELRSFLHLLMDSSHPIRKGKPISFIIEDLKNRRPGRLEDTWEDESIEAFLRKKMGTSQTSLPIVDYVVSAILHGIYAADASQLSVRSILPGLYSLFRTHGSQIRSILPSYLNRKSTSVEALASENEHWAQIEVAKKKRQDNEIEDITRKLGKSIVEDMKSTSILSFTQGIQTLTDAIYEECIQRGVDIRLGDAVTQIKPDKNSVLVATQGGKREEHFDRVISALPSKALDKSIAGHLPALMANSSSTVCVLNIALPPESNVRLPPGFGFLVPRACAREGDNKLGTLGVVFDSGAVPGQDDCTKLTMMFGGPYWCPGFGAFDLLTKGHQTSFISEALEWLGGVLALDVALLKSNVALKRLAVQKGCITTYTPGHLQRMSQLHACLQDPVAFGRGRMTVVGASYTGVSLNDCVLFARRTAQNIIEAEKTNHHSIVTGLEELIQG